MATWQGYDHSGQAATWTTGDSPVASGGQAQIYRTADDRWAIKAFSEPDREKQAREELALYRELAGQARLKQVLVELAGWGEGFLVFGWYGAGSLEAWMRVGGALRPLWERLRAAAACCRVVQELIEENLGRAASAQAGGAFVHWDIKPANFLVRAAAGPGPGRFEAAGGAQAWELRLCDLGGSVDARQQTRSSRGLLLTDGYAPPEQYLRLRGFNAPQIDVYSCAATVFHLITGDVARAPSQNARKGLSGEGERLKELLEAKESRLSAAESAELAGLQTRKMETVGELFDYGRCVTLTEWDRKDLLATLAGQALAGKVVEVLEGILAPDIRQRRISVEVLAHLLEEMADGLRRSAPVADVPVAKVAEAAEHRRVVPKPVKAPEPRAEPPEVKAPEVKAPELVPMQAPGVYVPKSVDIRGDREASRAAPSPEVKAQPVAPGALRPPEVVVPASVVLKAGPGREEKPSGTGDGWRAVVLVLLWLMGGTLSTMVVSGLYWMWVGSGEEESRELQAEAAEPGADWTSPTLGKMKWIAPGTFTMGSPESEDGRNGDETQHQVTLTKGFWLMEHEVTQGEWKAVMWSNPSYFKDCGAACPVENVSWDDIQTYIQKVSARDGVTYQLPTEAQWEYAARGGQEYTYAGSNDLGAVGWYGSNSNDTTHPGCQKQRNGYGLCDMSGNVREWVQDWYGTYPGNTSDYVNNGSGSYRVYRGGSWFNFSPSYARVAYRNWDTPGTRLDFLGFRLARLQ